MATDAQIDSLITEISQLARVMGGPNTITPQILEQNTQKVVTAIGLLASQLNQNTKTKMGEANALKRFQKAVQENTESIEKNTTAQEEAAQVTEEQVQRKRRADEENSRYERRQKIRDLTEGSAASKKYWDDIVSSGVTAGSLLKTKLEDTFLSVTGDTMKAKASLEFFKAAVEGITKSLTNYTAAIYKGERGATVSAKALSDLAKPVTDLLETISTVAAVLAFLSPHARALRLAIAAVTGGLALAGKAFTKYNEIAAEQTDKLFKTFNQLSKSSAAGAGGLDAVFTNLQLLGMSMSEIEDFGKLVSSNTQNLKLFGGTVADGTKRFAEVAGGLYKSDLGKQFEMLGITAEEQRASALSYMSIQARTGQLQLKTNQQLQKGAGEFVRELELAAQLTGQSREEVREAREAALAETRFRAAQIKAEREGDTERMAELKRYAEMAALVKNIPGAAEGIYQLGAARGVPTTKAAEAAGRTFGLLGGMGDYRDAKDQVELRRRMMENAKSWQDSTLSIVAYEGELDGLTLSTAKLDDEVKRQAAITEAARKMFPALDQDQAVREFLKTEEGKKLADKEVKNMVDAGRAQQSAALIMDAGVRTFNVSADINKKAAETFDKAVREFGNIAGVKVAGGTPTTGAPGTAAAPSAVMPGLEMVSPEFGGSAAMEYDAMGGATGMPAAPAAPAPKPPAPKAPAAQTRSLGRGGKPQAQAGDDLTKLFDFGSNTGSMSNFQELDPAFKQRVIAAAMDFTERTGQKIKVTSAWRDPADQQRLWDETVAAGRPGIGPTGNRVGKPGQSRHEQGAAVDIANYQNPAAVDAFNRQGLFQRVANDPVHFAANGGFFPAVPGGHKVIVGEGGEDEAVVPLRNGKGIPVDMPEQFNREMAEGIKNLNERMDQMLDIMGATKEIQSNLLNYTMS